MVIAIIGLLASIVLVSFKSVREKARLTKVLNFASQSYHAIGSGLVGYWDFNDNLDDISRNNEEGINYGVTFVEHNISPLIQSLRKAGYFDGNSYVEIPDSSGSLGGMRALTIEFWINYEPFTSHENRTILHKKDSFHAYLTGNGSILAFNYYPTGYQDFGSYKLVPGKWHHVLVGWDYGPPMERMSYLNGELMEHSTGVSGVNIGENNNPLLIGRGGGSNYVDFKGFIDGVRVYEEVLDLSQVQQLYAKEAPKYGIVVENQISNKK